MISARESDTYCESRAEILSWPRLDLDIANPISV